MSNPQRMLNAVIFKGIESMCLNKMERQKHSFVLTKRGGYYLVNRKRMSVKEFESLYPLTLQSFMKPTLDSTKIM